MLDIYRVGNTVEIEDPSPALLRILEDVLSYKRIEFVYAKGRRGGKFKSRLVDCFDYIEDSDGILPPRVAIMAGHLSRLAEALKHNSIGFQLHSEGLPSDKLFVPQWNKVSIKEFRYRQKEILEAMSAATCGRFRCPTGYGKTALIESSCEMWRKATIDIVTPSVEVTEQIYQHLRAKLPSVGLVTGAKKRDVDSRVLVLSGKSMHKGRAKTCDVLIFDEVHEAGTDDYIERIAEYRRARRFGLSANLDDRQDKADFELEGLFGPTLVDISYQEAVEHGCVVPIRVTWLPVIMDENPCGGYSASVVRERHGIWRNNTRNEIIANYLQALPPSEQVLVTVATLDHAMHLKKLMPEYTLCYAEKDYVTRRKWIRKGCITTSEPEMTRQRRALLKQQFSDGKLLKVIATSVWNRGVDFRNLPILVRADAKSTKTADTQIPGRVARIGDCADKPFGCVVDLMDQFDETFKRKAEMRRRHYKSFGWTQILPNSKSRYHQSMMF